MQALTRKQVRAVDRCAIDVLGIPGVILMENAGRNAAEVTWDRLTSDKVRRVAVVCGAGNNGGDGFVVTRHLANFGAEATCLLVAPREKLTDDAAVNLHALEQLDQPVEDFADRLSELTGHLARFDWVIDAIGGTGISGALRGAMAEAAEAINAADRPVLAIDIPTGLDCDTGLAEGPAVIADVTVTFVARKVGFDVRASERYTGVVHVVDIGIPAERVFARAGAEGLLDED